MAKSEQIANIEEIHKALSLVNGDLSKAVELLLLIVKNSAAATEAMKSESASVEGLGKATKQTNEDSKKKAALDKLLIASEKQLKESIEPQTKAILENRLAKQKNLQATKDQIKVEQAAEGSLVAMRLRLKELTTAYDNATVRTKAAAKEINNLSKEVQKAEESTNRHGRGVAAYADNIKKSALEMFSFAGVVALGVAALGKLKEQFASTDAGVKFFSKLKQSAKAFTQDVVNLVTGKGADAGLDNVKTAANAVEHLDKLRIEERMEAAKIAQITTEVKLLRLKAATTTDLSEQMKIYTEADKKEDEAIKIKSDHLKQEIFWKQQLWTVTKDSALADEVAAAKAELISIAGEKNLRIQTKLAAVGEKLAAQKEAENKKIIEGQKALQKEADDFNSAKSAANEKAVDDFIKEAEKEVDAATKAADEKWNAEVDFQRDLFKFNRDQEKKEADAKKEADDKIIEEEKKKAEDIKNIQWQMASEALNGIFSINAAKLDNELATLDKEKEAKLSNKNLTESQKAKIEAEYDKKAGALKSKQARTDKLQALFNIALETAKGIMSAVASFPLTGGMPFTAWVAAMGALQAGLVMAQPIPKYAKGTQSAKDRGIFGEAGRELMFLKSGEIALANQATYFEGNKFKGAVIKSNPETERMIAMTDRNNSGRIVTDDRLLNEMKLTRQAILSKPVAIYDKQNRIIGHATSKHQEIYFNKLMHKN